MAKKITEETHEIVPYIKTTGGKTFDGKPAKSGGYAMRGASNVELAQEIANLKGKGITATVDMRPVKLKPGESKAGDTARKAGTAVEAKAAKAPTKPAAKPVVAKAKPVRKNRLDGKPFSSASARGAKPTPAPRTRNNPNGELRPKANGK